MANISNVTDAKVSTILGAVVTGIGLLLVGTASRKRGQLETQERADRQGYIRGFEDGVHTTPEEFEECLRKEAEKDES